MSNITVVIDGRLFDVEVNLQPHSDAGLTVIVNGVVLKVHVDSLRKPEDMEWILVDNRPYEVVLDPDLGWIKAWDGLHRVEIQDKGAGVARPVSADGRVKAPIPGLVTRLLVSQSQKVRVGQPLLYLEAMKMENEIVAPRSGVVSQLNVKPGQSVALDEVLVEIV
jgi:biotin carboxyl carrier protein